jgi:RND family efflux transporter MFP subunit
VSVVEARVQEWPRVVRVQGSLLGDEHAVVGTRVAGLVKEVKADLGSVVKLGDVLATLDAEEFDLRVRLAEAHVKQARAKLGLRPDEPDEKLDRADAPPVRQERASLDEARAKLDRGRSLLRQKAIAVEEVQLMESTLGIAEARYQSALNGVDEQIAQLAALRAELDLARQQRDDAVIRAPFAGVVQERHVGPGVFLQRGASVVTLVRTDPLRFRAGVPEREAMQVHLGQPVRLEVQGEARPFETRVTRLSPSLDLASRSLMIEADLPNAGSRLPTGLFAEGEIVVDPKAPALVVPAGAVTEFAGVEKVWVVKDGQAREQRVRTGRRDRQRVEILDGLAAGDRVVADATQGRPGPVAVRPAGAGDGTAAD